MKKKVREKPQAKQQRKLRKNKQIKYYHFIILLFIIILLIIFIPLARKPKENYVKINDNRIKAEIADSLDEQTKGLMFRNSLPEKTGMLFVFDTPEILTFWMKNTLIPLDIIYIDENMHIVTIIRNAQPCEQDPCTIYRPESPSRYVLEINAGESDKLGIKEGDKVEMFIKD